MIWVAMVHDYWWHRDDPEYVQRFLPGIRGVLDWFEQRIDDTALLGAIPQWPYVDWADGWPRGMPPGASDGHSTVISLQFAYALDRAAELEAALGDSQNAADYRRLAGSLKEAVRANAWDPARRLIRQTPDEERFSQHANVLAILTGAIPQEEKAGLMQRLLADDSLTQSTYYFSYYLLEALRDSGLGDSYIEQLDPWREMLALGLTTVPETPEPGFRSVRITPHLGRLARAEGRVPHPLGNIDIALARTAADGLRVEVTLPPGLDGVLEWDGEEFALTSGQQNLDL